MKDVYELYKDKISYSGFQYCWLGKTWKDIMPEVFLKRNPSRNSGGSKLSDEDVLNIRIRFKNNEDKDAIFEDYKNKIGRSGFNKIINYTTWKNIKV